MKKSLKIIFSLIMLCAFMLVPFCGCDIMEGLLYSLDGTGEESIVPVSTEFSMHFIDVGQGDCILIRSGEHTMLVDAGENSAESAVADYLDKQKIDSFDYVMGTHAHSDHIGSLDYAVAHFQVDKMILPPQEGETNMYKKLVEAAEKTDVEIEHMMAGDSFSLGEAQFYVLAPNQKEYSNINNSSIVLKVVFGSTSFLLTGDAETLSEEEMIEAGVDLKADVLKVGHHGSDTSTSYTFLREVMPTYAVIQVGEGNDYGHPHEKILSRLNDERATVYRNDIHGDIVITSDGENLEIFTENDMDPIYSNRESGTETGYIGNSKSKKLHTPDCGGLPAEENRVYFATKEEALAQGYEPCGNCDP